MVNSWIQINTSYNIAFLSHSKTIVMFLHQLHFHIQDIHNLIFQFVLQNLVVVVFHQIKLVILSLISFIFVQIYFNNQSQENLVMFRIIHVLNFHILMLL